MEDNDALNIQDMHKSAQGDLEAFCGIVRRNQQILLNFFLRLGAKQDRAEDLTQDTFLRLYQWREKYKASARFSTFLFTLARHVWIDSGRKERRTLELHDEGAAEALVDHRNDPAETGRRLDVQEALERLSEKLRVVVVMNIYGGMNYKEIGAALEIPEGTVKSRMWQAMRELRELLEDKGYADGKS